MFKLSWAGSNGQHPAHTVENGQQPNAVPELIWKPGKDPPYPSVIVGSSHLAPLPDPIWNPGKDPPVNGRDHDSKLQSGRPEPSLPDLIWKPGKDPPSNGRDHDSTYESDHPDPPPEPIWKPGKDPPF